MGGGIAGRKEKEVNWSFGTRKTGSGREGGIMSEMPCSTSVDKVTVQPEHMVHHI